MEREEIQCVVMRNYVWSEEMCLPSSTFFLFIFCLFVQTKLMVQGVHFYLILFTLIHCRRLQQDIVHMCHMLLCL